VFNEDRSVAVVCNGEIYNYRQLRDQLHQRGHQFASDSDVEVIAHLWEEYGTDLADHLNGMFAIAIHDSRRQKVLLLRDHLGINPLFYAIDGQQLVFGSEVKALLASGRVPRRLNVEALSEFLSWEYVPGAATLLADVAKLEPGHWLELDTVSGAFQRHQYWDIPLANHRGDGCAEPCQRAWTERVSGELNEAVQKQMVSDVPLGAFLSGGVDSSLVVSAMGAEARTFSIGFDDPTYNELPWAKRVAEHLGVEHLVDIVQPDVEDLCDHLMQFMDDPIGDFSIFPTYQVSRHASRHVTVALSGDGGDELFGGYETHLAQLLADRWQAMPMPGHTALMGLLSRLPPTSKKKGLINKVQRFAEGLGHPPELGHARWRLFMGEALRETLFTGAAKAQMTAPVGEHIRRLSERARDCDPLTRALYVDAKSYMPDNCLVKMDRMSMANSLEARVPMLDKHLVSTAFQTPPPAKIERQQTKRLLKRLARQRVPPDCVDRPKEGFSIPLKHWLRDQFRERMETLLHRSRIEGEGLFEPAVVERLKDQHLKGRANNSHVLWSLMVFEDWRERWGA
jgi:asparagine synthase (glutamine-hydrolysing)